MKTLLLALCGAVLILPGCLAQSTQEIHMTKTVDIWIYACKGDNVSLDWTFNASEAGPKIYDVTWYYQNLTATRPEPKREIAYFVHNRFHNLFNTKVTQMTTDAGLLLTDVDSSDSGAYSIIIWSMLQTRGITKAVSTYLNVNERFFGVGGILRLTQSKVAEWSNSSQKNAVKLICGPFNFNRNILTQGVLFTLPDKTEAYGEMIIDWDYHQASYVYYLTSPVQKGKYSCEVKKEDYAVTCLNLHDDADTLGKATINVDDIKVEQLLETKTLEDMTNYLMRTGGSTFTIWGRTSCPKQALTIYKGYTGGSPYGSHGGSSKWLCMIADADKVVNENTPNDVYASRIVGVEYEINRQSRGHPVLCAKCQTRYSYVINIWGSNLCPNKTVTFYQGHVVTSSITDQGNANYVCLDKDPEIGKDPGPRLFGSEVARASYVYPVCKSLPCPPYKENSVILCAVCGAP